VAPDAIHPVLNRRMSDLLADLDVIDGDLTAVAQQWHRHDDEVDNRLHDEIA